MKISKKFECTMCGECCRGFGAERFVPLIDNDIQGLSALLGISIASFKKRYTEERSIKFGKQAIQVDALTSIDGDCVFLESDGLCAVQEKKPFICMNSPEFLLKKSMARDFDCMKGLAEDDDPEVEAEYINGILRR